MADKDSNRDPTTILLEEKKIEGGGLALAFTGMHSYALFTQKNCSALNKIPGHSDDDDGVDVSGNKIHFIKQQCLLFDTEVRKLVNESACTFLSSRNVPESVHDLRSYFLSCSQEHRSSIRLCIENMQLKEVDHPHYKEWIEMFDNIEIVWHLIELLHLDPVVGDHSVGKLVEWVRYHCFELELRANILLMEDRPEMSDTEEYWDLVTGLILQARFEPARAVLKLHTLAHTTPFLEAYNVLNTVPVFNVNCGLSVSEFKLKWRAWKSSVRSKINSGIFSKHAQLLEIMEIAGGESDGMMKRLKKYCDTWYQLLSASLVFIDPTVRLNDLPYYAQLCINEFGGLQNMKLLDQTIHAAIESDLAKVISTMQLSADGGWSAAHLANLLYVCRCFASHDYMEGEVDQLLVEYGSVLVSEDALWSTGISYLEHCGKRSSPHLAAILSSIPLTSEARAYRIVEVARTNNLTHIAKSVSRCMSMKYLKQGSLGNALHWGLESQEKELLGCIAVKLLESYSADPSYYDNFLLHLGKSAEISPRLFFAAQYTEFNHLLSQKEYKEAATVLFRTMDVKIVPKFFASRLLYDAMSLLELGPEVVSTMQALVMLECLEDMVSENWVLPDRDALLKIRTLIANHLAITRMEDILPKQQSSARIIRVNLD